MTIVYDDWPGGPPVPPPACREARKKFAPAEDSERDHERHEIGEQAEQQQSRRQVLMHSPNISVERIDSVQNAVEMVFNRGRTTA